MGKSGPLPSKTTVRGSNANATSALSELYPQPATTTTSAVAADPVLGYKLRVLLHDFLHVTKDRNAARRINCTINEHYISGPYFDDRQAAVIKAALVDVNLSKRNPLASATEHAQVEASTEDQGSTPDTVGLEGQTFEAAIQVLLKNFIDKRRASGDARPCGPHHLAPLYAWLFGIEMEELRAGKFLSRLRRNGLGIDQGHLP